MGAACLRLRAFPSRFSLAVRRPERKPEVGNPTMEVPCETPGSRFRAGLGAGGAGTVPNQTSRWPQGAGSPRCPRHSASIWSRIRACKWGAGRQAGRWVPTQSRKIPGVTSPLCFPSPASLQERESEVSRSRSSCRSQVPPVRVCAAALFLGNAFGFQGAGFFDFFLLNRKFLFLVSTSCTSIVS